MDLFQDNKANTVADKQAMQRLNMLGQFVRVFMQGQGHTVLKWQANMTAHDLLLDTCHNRNVYHRDYYLVASVRDRRNSRALSNYRLHGHTVITAAMSNFRLVSKAKRRVLLNRALGEGFGLVLDAVQFREKEATVDEVVVEEVIENSPACLVGISAGDCIVSIGDEHVSGSNVGYLEQLMFKVQRLDVTVRHEGTQQAQISDDVYQELNTFITQSTLRPPCVIRRSYSRHRRKRAARPTQQRNDPIQLLQQLHKHDKSKVSTYEKDGVDLHLNNHEDNCNGSSNHLTRYDTEFNDTQNAGSEHDILDNSDEDVVADDGSDSEDDLGDFTRIGTPPAPDGYTDFEDNQLSASQEAPLANSRGTPLKFGVRQMLDENEPVSFARQVSYFIRDTDTVTEYLRQLVRPNCQEDTFHFDERNGNATLKRGQSYDSDLSQAFRQRSQTLERHPQRLHHSQRRASVGNLIGSGRSLKQENLSDINTNVSGSSLQKISEDTRMVDVLGRHRQMKTLPMSSLAEKKSKELVCLHFSVIELLETERSYVESLDLIEGRFLQPLMEERLLSPSDQALVVSNLPELISFQRGFLRQLESACRLVAASSSGSKYSNTTINMTPDNAKTLVRTVEAISLLFHTRVEQMRVYARYCAAHSSAIRVVNNNDNHNLQAWLDARNPRQEQSATLASYLIKPVQRILKYPLLMKQMFSHLPGTGPAKTALKQAIKSLSDLAAHINDTTRLCETFSEALAHGLAAFNLSENLDALKSSQEAVWVNVPDDRGKPRKHIPCHLLVFTHGVIVLEKLPTSDKPSKKKGPSSITPLPQYSFVAFIPMKGSCVESGLDKRVPAVGPNAAAVSWTLYHAKQDAANFDGSEAWTATCENGGEKLKKGSGVMAYDDNDSLGMSPSSRLMSSSWSPRLLRRSSASAGKRSKRNTLASPCMCVIDDASGKIQHVYCFSMEHDAAKTAIVNLISELVQPHEHVS